MSSYFTSLTAQYSSLRRLLPTSLSEETDLHITNPEDSHVSRVLRAHYTERGRPFPPWLGPDPNSIPKNAPSPALARPQPYPVAYNNSSTQSLRTPRGPPTGLSDLFDSPPTNNNNTNPPPEALSLRARRPGGVTGGGIRSPHFKGGSSDSIPYPTKITPQPEPTNVRPLPSQRIGSYQSRQTTTPPLPSTSGSETSVQSRLKARLGAGSSSSRGASPVFGSSSGNSYIAPPQHSSSSSTTSAAAFNPYEATGGGGGGGGGSGGRNPYASNTGDNRYGESNDGQNARAGDGKSDRAPYMGADSPWTSGDDFYGGDLGGAGPEYISGSGGGNGSYASGGSSYG